MLNLPFPSNPDYGNGATRRRIHLWFSEGSVRGLLSDIFHEMECSIAHDGEHVTTISGRMIRIPNTACPSAPSMLPGLVGTKLGVDAQTFYANDVIRQHCTHLFDLAFMVIAHGQCPDTELVYEAVVPDRTEPAAAIEVEGWRNGVKQLSWSLADETIVEPEALSGKSVCKGFSKWAYDRYAPDELMLPLLISRTCLLARGRAYRIDAFPGEPITMLGNITGACYAYAPERMHDARFVPGSVRDFSDGVEEGS